MKLSKNTIEYLKKDDQDMKQSGSHAIKERNGKYLTWKIKDLEDYGRDFRINWKLKPTDFSPK